MADPVGAANPYQAPQSRLAAAGPQMASQFADGGRWVSGGFAMVRASPGPWILLALLYLGIQVCSNFVPFLGVIVTLLNMVLIGGVMLACTSQANSGAFGIDALWRGFSDAAFGQLMLLGGLLLFASVLFVVLLVVTAIVLFGASILSSGVDFAHLLSADPGGLTSMLVASLASLSAILLVALLGATLLGMAFWLAPARVALGRRSATEALGDSFGAYITHWRGLTTYSLAMGGLLLLACIPALAGLLLWVPLAFASTWCVHRDLFAVSASAAPQPP